MNLADPNWQPDAQLLYAYFDGELEGRDELADLRTRVETWLEAHPEAVSAWKKHRELQKLWLATTPAEPSEAAWQTVVRSLRDRDEGRVRQPGPRVGAAARKSARRLAWLTGGVAAACIAICLGLALAAGRFLTLPAQPEPKLVNPPSALADPEDGEVLTVASADEILILRIEDADSPSVVIGTFPVSGPLEFADSGEVCISCRCPRVLVRQDPGYRPMVSGLARAESE